MNYKFLVLLSFLLTVSSLNFTSPTDFNLIVQTNSLLSVLALKPLPRLDGYYNLRSCTCQQQYETCSDLFPSRIQITTNPLTNSFVGIAVGSVAYAPFEGYFWLESGVVQFTVDVLLCEGIFTDFTNGFSCVNANGEQICQVIWECYDGDCYTTAGQQYARAFVFTVVALLWGVFVVAGGATIWYSSISWLKKLSLIDALKTTVVLQIVLSLFHIWTPLNYHAFGNVLSAVFILSSSSDHRNALVVFGVAGITFVSNGGWNSLIGGGTEWGYQKAFYEQLARSFNSKECFIRYAAPENDFRCTTLVLIGMWGSWIILIFQFVYMFWAGWSMYSRSRKGIKTSTSDSTDADIVMEQLIAPAGSEDSGSSKEQEE